MKNRLLTRIGLKNNIEDLLKKICSIYSLGNFENYELITVGYEDLNLILKTNSNKYFLKIFASFRNAKNRIRYIDIMLSALKSGVNHPKLYKIHDEYLHKITVNSKTVFFCVMEYLDGRTFYDLKSKPNDKEASYLIKQAAIINKIDIKPYLIYDSWAVVNFISEYEKIKGFLNKEDNELITKLLPAFKEIGLDTLPHCFVHGDIIDTNVMKTTNGSLYILDFSVSNYYPRIVELSVMFTNILFTKSVDFPSQFDKLVKTYSQFNPLTKKEVELLPLFIQVAHAMHIIGSTKSIHEGGRSKENLYWLGNGRKGLRFTQALWNT